MIDLKKILREKPLAELINFSIINIDKPSGPTSFLVDRYIKEKLADFNIKKTSHFGTLDPKVSGVLPVAIGRACRLLNYFMHHNKTYVGIMRLHKTIDEVGKEKLEKTIKKFIGKIKQLPPVKSSVKRKEREREVFSFSILEISENRKDILFETKVQAGTYIRKLIDDIGREMNCGAHMLELRRIKAGIFDESKKSRFINLYDFDRAIRELKEKNNEKKIREILIPAEIISEILDVVEINKKYIRYLHTGKILKKEHLITGKENLKKGKLIAAFSGDKFMGVYECQSDKSAKPCFVYN